MSVWKPIAEIAADVNAGRVTALENVEKSLQIIAEKADYNAISTIIDERARARAVTIDELVARGENAGRLAGVPFVAKDSILVFGADATASSNILRGFDPPYQSTVIERLEAEGAICVAKGNQDAFGHGASTENSDNFITLNPHDKSRVPGGSSGGPAAAVVLEIAPFAIGTDTGGSVRQPASFVGCVGFRPTYGLTSRSGVVAMASSTDTVGPLARTIDDLTIVFDVYAGHDPLDSTTIDRDPMGYLLSEEFNVVGKKIGVIKEWMSEGVDDDVRQSIDDSIAKLKQSGAVVEEVSMPSLSLALAVYYILVPAEISSNLSRYDGQRYAYHALDPKDLEDSYSQTRQIGFGAEAKRRLMIGTYVLSSGYYDAYYRKAQIVRTKLINEFDNIFKEYDFLIGPVAPEVAFKIGQHSDDPLKMYLIDMMTVAPALVGVPALSIPSAVSGKNGMPIGLQIIAPRRHDRELLMLAKETEEILAK